MTSTQQFATEQEAARELLAFSTKLLLEHSVDFVIVGGWAPYLLDSQPFGHPGTLDVDVLVSSDSLDDGSFDRAADSMLKLGFLRAAKNRFQLHRVSVVGTEEMLFHVDFLNEQAPSENELNLIRGTKLVMSIYTPPMKAVFGYEGYRFADPAEHADLRGVRFPSVVTFVASKAAAMMAKKRIRDAFDVFVTIHSGEYGEEWAKLVASDGLFRESNKTILHAVVDGDAIEKVRVAIGDLDQPVPTKKRVRRVFRDFLVNH